MENILLIILLIFAVALIGVVLLQRSEGGGLGIGGGGGGVMSGRSAATALGKLTWLLGIGFMLSAMAMTVVTAQKSGNSSVIDQLGADAPAASSTPAEVPAGEDLLPPSAADGSLAPTRADD